MHGKKSVVFLITYLLLATLVSPALANQQVLNVPAYSQEKSNWCWAACDNMIISYYQGTSPTQSQIVTYVFGSPVNQTATLMETQSALTRWQVQSSATSNALSYTQVKNNISKGSPIIAAFSRGSSGPGHMNVVHGFNTQYNSVAFIDPADGQYHVQNYLDYANGYHYDGYYYTWQESIYLNQ